MDIEDSLNCVDSTNRTVKKKSLIIECSLLAGLTSLIVFGQLLAGPIWAQLSGAGAFASAFFGVTGLLIWIVVFFIACFGSPEAAHFFRVSKGLQCLRVVSVILGFSIIYPFGFQFDNAYPWAPTAMVMLNAIVCGLAIWHNWAYVLHAFLVTVVFGSYLSTPPYRWDVTDLRHTLNLQAITVAAIVLTAGVGLIRSRCQNKCKKNSVLSLVLSGSARYEAFLTLALIACSISYFYAGVMKVIISSRTGWLVDGVSWIWREKIDHLVQYFSVIGCTWIPNFCDVTTAIECFRNPFIRITMCSIVLLGELGAITCLLSRRYWLVSIIGCQLLHIGFAVMCGAYFWHWFVMNCILLIYFNRYVFSSLTTLFTFYERALATVVFIFLSPLIFHTCALGWLTGSESKVIVCSWHVVAKSPDEKHHLSIKDPESDLLTQPVNPNHFFPYEKNFQMSWMFGDLFSDPEYIETLSKNTHMSEGQDSTLRVANDTHNTIGLREIPNKNLKKIESLSIYREVCAAFSAGLEFYKYRFFGEWHEHLVSRTNVKRDLISSLTQVVSDAHLRQSRGSLWPPYYSHMTFNKRLFGEEAVSEKAQEYLLIKHVFDSQFEPIEQKILFRCAVPANSARKFVNDNKDAELNNEFQLIQKANHKKNIDHPNEENFVDQAFAGSPSSEPDRSLK